MTKIVSCELRGGLCNQMFNIFTTIAYSIRNNINFVFLKMENFPGPIKSRPSYWNSFFINLEKYLVNKEYYKMEEYSVLKESQFNYQELPNALSIKGNVVLDGYYQSYKYFEKEYQFIYNLLEIEYMKKNIENTYHYDYSNFISMHFRLGDYKYLSHFHPILSHVYYKNAIDFIIKKTKKVKLNFFYFCEEEDIQIVESTIEYLKNEFPRCIFVRITHSIPDWQQMLIMSMCEHNIIANSSFSWWGAYLNDNKNKIVCYPSVWFVESAGYNMTDMFPESWDKITAS